MSDYRYFVIGYLESTDSDLEIDLVLNGVYMVFQAIEIAKSPEATETTAAEMKRLLPECGVMVTHCIMSSVLDTKLKLNDLNDELKQCGIKPPISDKPSDRYDLMFDWRKQQLTVIHGGVQ
jgi:hypothetical protein